MLVNNIKTTINLLKSAGIDASNISVFFLPNFKYIPAIHQLVESLSDPVQTVILSILSGVSINYNNSMKNLAIREGANFFDISKYFIDIVNNPEKYKSYYGEFATDSSLSVCVDTIDNPLNNQNMNYPLCQGFVFYNNVHPTTYTHKIVADEFEKYLDSKK
jgi:phospholipase/lecithinase/hemolysin